MRIWKRRLLGSGGKLYDQIDKVGFTALEEGMNQLNVGRCSHFPGRVRFVSLNDTCQLNPINQYSFFHIKPPPKSIFFGSGFFIFSACFVYPHFLNSHLILNKL
jgi:hypothetical protein